MQSPLSKSFQTTYSFFLSDEEGGAPGPLGTVPHQVRGGLYEFDQMTLYGPVFPSCVGCSDAVLNEYSTKGFQFIKDVLNNPTRLTEVSGINTMLEGADVCTPNIPPFLPALFRCSAMIFDGGVTHFFLVEWCKRLHIFQISVCLFFLFLKSPFTIVNQGS